MAYNAIPVCFHIRVFYLKKNVLRGIHTTHDIMKGMYV